MTDEITLNVVTLSEVRAERVVWLAPSRIALGKLNVIEGHPGTGKSTITMGIAADLTRGRPLFGGSHPIEASDVVILTAEDGLGDTVKPRVLAAGGDTARIHAIESITLNGDDRSVSIPEHLPAIRELIIAAEAKVFIVDPLNAFMGGEINSFKDHDVRRALAPLARLAEETGCAVILVRHLTKATQGSAITAGGGSIGIIGAARTALLVAADPEQPRRGILAVVKCNLAARAPSLSFEIAPTGEDSSRIEWRGECSHTADGLIAAGRDQEEKGAMQEAIDFLKHELRAGPTAKKQLSARAQEECISKPTLDRAATRLNVIRTKDKAFQGVTMWALPSHAYQHEETGLSSAPNSSSANTSASSSNVVRRLERWADFTPDEEKAFLAEQDRLISQRKPAA